MVTPPPDSTPAGWDATSAAIEAAAGILARGLSCTARLQADGAEALGAGITATAEELAKGAEVVKTIAHDGARDAARAALHAAQIVATTLGVDDEQQSFTPARVMLAVAKSDEAAAQQAAASRAISAYASAEATAELATRAASSAAVFEADLAATAVAAHDLATIAPDVDQVAADTPRTAP